MSSDPDELLESIAAVIDRALYRHPAEIYPTNEERQTRPFDYWRMARVLAALDSARFLEENFATATNLVGRQNLLRHACRSTDVAGAVLEFGVMNGDTLSILCEEFDDRIVHGFDSFNGLPEQWTHDRPAGAYGMDGSLPDNLPANATLHVGMFEDCIPRYLDKFDAPVALLHIDSDIYSSARTTLFGLAARLQPGSIIVFDEFLNYPGWRKHEYRAFMEFAEHFRVEYSYLSFASSYLSVAVRIETAPALS